MDSTLHVLAVSSTYICPRRLTSRQAESPRHRVQPYWREKIKCRILRRGRPHSGLHLADAGCQLLVNLPPGGDISIESHSSDQFEIMLLLTYNWLFPVLGNPYNCALKAGTLSRSQLGYKELPGVHVDLNIIVISIFLLFCFLSCKKKSTVYSINKKHSIEQFYYMLQWYLIKVV